MVRSKKRTPRDDLWDVIVAVWFSEGLPKSQQTRVGRLVTDFAVYCADPDLMDLDAVNTLIDSIRSRYERCAKTWKPEMRTPEALVKHWNQFKPPKSRRHPYGFDPETEHQMKELRRRDVEQAAMTNEEKVAEAKRIKAEYKRIKARRRLP